MNDVNIIKGEGGLGRLQPNTDNIRGLVMNIGTVAPLGLAVNTPKLLLQTKDAEDVGIDAAYDIAQTCLCYYHIKEFFAENPNGKLWIYLVAQATTLTQMADGTAVTPCPVKKLALATNGEIKQYGIARNPIIGYTPTITAAIDVDVTNAIPKAQVLMDDLFAGHMPSDIVIEGRSFSGSVATLVSLRLSAAPNVRVVFAQDLDVAPPAADPVIKGHAAVGTFLGTSSKAKVSESVGWVEKFNLSSIAFGRWLNVGLSSNTAITAFTLVDMNTLNTKGVIFVRNIVGESGAWWHDAHSCCPADSDYAMQESVLTMNKGVRGVYKALVPKISSPVKVNADGQLSSEVILSLESVSLKPLTQMEMDDEISNKDIYINPAQNIITSNLKVKISLQPIGVARIIDVEIGLVAKI